MPQRDRKTTAPPDPSPNRLFTVFDLKGSDDRLGQLRRIPELTLEALRLVWRASARHFAMVTLLQFGAAAAVAVQLLVGREVLQELMAVGRGAIDAEALIPGLALLVGVTILMGAIGAFVAHQQRFLTEMVAVHTFDRIIDVATRVELASFEDPQFYDQLTRARTSGLSKPVEMVGGVSALIMSVLTSLGIGIALVTMHPILLPLVVLSSVPLLLATLRNSQQAYEFEFGWTPRNRERFYLMQLLTGREPAQELRVFGATGFLRRRYDALTDERLSRLKEFLRRRLRVAMMGTVGGAIGAAFALGALVWLVVTGRIDVATAVTAGAAMQMLISRFSTLTKSVGNLVEAGMFLDDYRTFLTLEGDVDEPAPEEDGSRPVAGPPRTFGGLRVEDVSFAYPKTEKVVLHDVSLEVEPGEVVALVGENGSGKTTLVKLICQLYRPQTGRIVWNGVDATDLDPEELRSQITVIFQDFIHYHLTALENIALGRVDLPPEPERIADAARQAGAHEFLSRLPQGYDTRLGRQFYGGHELSVGQWQRLALARAFFREGSFLVLDEPTAALDPRAEHELFSQMRALSEGRSVLLVSHRFSSVRSADRIYVLEGGRITEAGSHSELLALGGHYAELFTLQAAAYLDDGGRASTSLSSHLGNPTLRS
ncbi:MAG: ABC transporter ATP-binding protein/permease [Gemmatimonadetes bacterium]|nr:ABC transporter ATP-binding protein/permease [Gemmatimonadota bacterium]